MKFGFENAKLLQQYSSFADIVSRALGGTKKNSVDEVYSPKNEDELTEALNAVIGA